MRKTTVRFTDELWELLEREAKADGVSVAQLVRDAALFRIAYKSGVRDARERRPQADDGLASRR
jgi:predicted DNA-binding ribbon-helix-helix protein